MAMTSDKWRGAWAGSKAPSVLPGFNTDTQEPSTSYVDENGQPWLVEAYVTGASAFPSKGDYHWHATTTNPANIYGEDSTAPAISGSESEFAAVAAIDVYAAEWKRKHAVPTAPAAPTSDGGAVLWLVILVAFAMSDGKKRR